ncbi:ion channel [Hyunsoonleella aestuarii]|uniref:Potassium channel family protein n=1 Tax=Hyunsoonleella aestuarii TaxID=912802 RepID=A0ABP8E807_9FLAO|nr:ion channel [Hyunsoonleella aestuarii]
MLKRFYPYRFQIFFFSQIAILFGSLIVPTYVFETFLSPVLFLLNLLTGIVLLSKKRKTMWFLVALLVISTLLFGSNLIETVNEALVGLIKMGTYFLFYVVVTSEIIKQVWRAKKVSKNVIFGLVSGYISLGLIGFFICLSIEMVYPNSFTGLIAGVSITENLMYYSYISLLTIGYGDILPISALAHKATILIGLMGQIYLVIITAIVVGKYINQSTE